ncbi:DNA polymerase I [bacterium]|nr:DNA polymerase I [bacterium]
MNNPSDNTLWLIDGSGWLYRAFHALPPLTAPDGSPTGAVYGFGNMLRGLLREQNPQRIAVIFDARGKNFRHELDPNYKANRPPVPPDLSDQFQPIVDLVEALGIPMLQISGVEADDVIGTLAHQLPDGMDLRIVSGDKDLAQLINERVVMIDTMKGKTMDVEGVVEKFGVPPERIIDLLALMGDSSDNIPGIEKCGVKTAAKWINNFGDLDAIIAKNGEIGGKIGENLRAGLEQLPKSRELATIKTDVELDIGINDLCRGEADSEALLGMYKRLGFNRWLDDPVVVSEEQVEDAVAAPSVPNDTTYHTVLDQDAFDAMLKALQSAELICLDCETDALDAITGGLVGLSFAVEPGEAWYLPFTHDYMGAPDQLDRDACLEALKPVLENADIPKLGQHIKYDLNVLAHHGVAVRGVAYDTMLESFTLNAGGSRHDMDTLAKLHLNLDTVKFEDIAGKGKKQLSFNQIDLEQAAPYASEDADITLRLHQQIWGQLEKTEGQRHIFEAIEMPLVPVLADIERTGVRIDKQTLADLTHEFGERIDELAQQAHDIAGQPFNLGSPSQIGEILFDKMELPVLRKTPKGAPSTNEAVLSELAEEYELPKLILDWRSLSKLRSTYTLTLPERINAHTGRVHTSYHQAGAATGRLSSSDPNLQNIPIRTSEGRRIREAFIPPDGHKLLAIDYSQVELRLMAHFSEDKSLIEAFRNGQDIHSTTAAEVWGVPLDDVSGDQRRAAKAINFGLIYGISAFGLARNLNIGRAEAAEHIDTFFARYPGVKAYMDGCKAKAKDDGFVETLYGRRLYLPDIKARNQAARSGAERVAINAPLQGTAADIIKRAMIDIHAWLAAEKLPAKMIMQVHDELVFEVAEDAAEDMAKRISDRMEAAADLAVPLLAEAGIGDNWDAAH